MSQKQIYYKVLLYGGHEIQIDPDEIQDVVNKLPTGQLIRVRNGIFNASIAAVVIDSDRTYYQKKDTKGNYIVENSQDIFKNINFNNKQKKLLN